MKKKILFIFLLVSILALHGCGKTGETDTAIGNNITSEMVESNMEALIDELGAMSMQQLQEVLVQVSADESSAIYNLVRTLIEKSEEFGTYQSIIDYDFSTSGKTVTGKMNLSFTNKEVEFEFVADDETGTITSMQLAAKMSLGDKMSNAGLNTLIGMGVVFAALIFISFLISMFKYINKAERYFTDKKANKNKADEVFEPVDPAKAPVLTDTPPEDEQSQTELVAVITAAVAASMNTSIDNLVVRSISRRNIKR